MISRFIKLFLSISSVFLFANLQPTTAEVKMPAIFGDHMVLQQEAKIPVWGWAAPGENVKVTLGAQTATATADANGDWRVDLAPLPANGTVAAPQVLTIAGANTLTFQDVLVGDVWIASGQSNMEFGLAHLGQPDVIAKADEPQLRLFTVPKAFYATPQKDIGPVPADSLLGKWQVCTPETVAKDGSWQGFSAVAYFFGREIQHSIGRPVGLISTSWGGTPAQSWTSLDGLQKDAVLAHYVEACQKNAVNFPQAYSDFLKQAAEYEEAKKLWDQEVGDPLKLQMEAWAKQSAEAAANSKPEPPKPAASRPAPKPPVAPGGGAYGPTNLYNAMIAPLVPYAIKGAIWYQGEANAGSKQSGEEYAILFPRMINDWREKWSQGEFPFLFVQLANFTAPAKLPCEGTWPWLREAQTKTLALPNTGMAVTIDIGNTTDIHPKDKLDVGLRLALAARHIAYGQDLVYSGPIYDSMKVEGNKIIISFTNVGGGLKIGGPPWSQKIPAELTGFAIAGDDKNWLWARAEIDGDKVVVTSDQVPAPVAVRYGWANSPPVDLYNKEGLPASPFRTDTWQDAPPAPAPK
ncbi:MAG: sialate O-acetylesterase [Methylacidiphilales bacterium]|nr:sialate O-acetylesterase [Candidatus Methylacidiphilales bacterium]